MHVSKLDAIPMLLLDHAFHARSIAVVGASANRTKWANMLFRRLIDGPYRGRLAAVNPARRDGFSRIASPAEPLPS